MRISPLFAIDGYKLSHRPQYPVGTSKVYGNFTPRSNKYAHAPYFKGITGGTPLVWAGMQTFIAEWFLNRFKVGFFDKPVDEVVGKFQKSVNAYLGTEYDVSVFEALHAVGYMPVRIKSIPEGTAVDIKTPVFTIINTIEEFFWLPNFLETLFSAELWPVSTSATTAFNYRLQSEFWAAMTCADNSHVQFQCHDFAARGNMGMEANSLTGIGHLMVFSGTDSVYARERFNLDYPMSSGHFGWSVPATEHSVMCMGTQEAEQDTYDRLLELYPVGIVSVVSDTWDFFSVLTNILPALKHKIMARKGKLVIRPDSGDPTDIICGRQYKDYSNAQHLGEVQTHLMRNVGSVGFFRGEYYTFDHANEEMVVVPEVEIKGAIQLLWETFGGTINQKGFRVLDEHIGLIYGDSITLERQLEIFERLADKDFASSNVVLGIGSYAYQYVTRDTFGFAMKATWGVVDGVERAIFKDPATDDGTKKSARGLIRHFKDENGNWKFEDSVSVEEEAASELPVVYEDGIAFTETGDVVRARVESEVSKYLSLRVGAIAG